MYELKIEKIKLSELHLDKENLRKHNEEEIDLLVRSLTIFGQYKPIIVDKNTMIVKIGNGRLMAMRKMGWTDCDCILLDVSNNKGMEIVDNRLNELSDWQDKDLKKWFKSKGSDWWGIDDAIRAKVTSYEDKPQQALESPKNEDKGNTSNEHLCPCCGKPLIKKDRLTLD